MYKVLIVDDEPIAVEATEYILSKNFDNIIIDVAYSGKAAIERAKIIHPDIIIMDINMPYINGIEAMKQIRMINSIQFFIVTSASEYSDYEAECKVLEVVEYLNKPINRQKFIAAVTKVLNLLDKRV